MFTITGELNEAKVFAHELEDGAIEQIRNLCCQHFLANATIRVMPDAHAGAGCTIGTTLTIHDTIVPNLVGVDISCGVEAVNVGSDPIDFESLDMCIRQYIPSGFACRKIPHDFASQLRLHELTCHDARVDPFSLNLFDITLVSWLKCWL